VITQEKFLSARQKSKMLTWKTIFWAFKMKFLSPLFFVYTVYLCKEGLLLSEVALPYFSLIFAFLLALKQTFIKPVNIQSSLFEYSFAQSHSFMEIG